MLVYSWCVQQRSRRQMTGRSSWGRIRVLETGPHSLRQQELSPVSPIMMRLPQRVALSRLGELSLFLPPTSNVVDAGVFAAIVVVFIIALP